MSDQGKTTRLVVFQQNGSAEQKIRGIREHGRHIEIVRIFDITTALPDFIEQPAEYIPDDLACDLVLDFLRHPDLAEYLAELCRRHGIPLVASGKKTKDALTPFTCCGLGKNTKLGAYGEQFGFPEFKVELRDNRINRIEVRRGAPCGATWDVLPRIVGTPVARAVSDLAREVQYICKADPSSFDPISGKSPLHYAGEVHIAALTKAIAEAEKK